MKANYHTHSTWCDGRNTPEEMVVAAIAKGFDEIGFSSHAMLPGTLLDWGLTAKNIEAYAADIRALAAKYEGRIKVLCGVEADYAPMDYTSFLVYYVDGDSMMSFNYEIFGGYDEMFFAWKNQNGIAQDVLLKDMTIHSASDGDSEFSLNSDLLSANILRVTLSSSFSSYLEENDSLLLESLKKTVASYLGIRISEIELFLTE